MCYTLNKTRQEHGYTLIEIAVALIVVGILIAPAMFLYGQWQMERKAAKTAGAMASVERSIGTFRSSYGRYPCPAPLTVPRDDPSYGHEDCSATAPGVATVTSNRALVNPNIYLGAVPFRTLSLTEDQTIDGSGNRMIYGATAALTDVNTFNMNIGGISIIDHEGESRIFPEHSAHFIVLSHNNVVEGAYSREGSLVGVCPAGNAGENCNRSNSVFLVGEKLAAFDDLAVYSTDMGVQLWQISNITPSNIHLRGSTDAENVIIGASLADDVDGAERLEVREGDSGDGVIRAAGGFIASEICDEDGDNCFRPERIGGTIGNPGEGMACEHPTPYLIGIQGGEPLCTNEVSFACPAGQFFGGITSQGNLICNVVPPEGCSSIQAITACGVPRTITDTGHGQFRTVYSGLCYNFGPGNIYSAAELTSRIDARPPGVLAIDVARDYIDELNNGLRAPATSCNLVRDIYRCDEGTFRWHSSHEQAAPDGNFGGTNQEGGFRPSEAIYNFLYNMEVLDNVHPTTGIRAQYREYDGANIPAGVTLAPAQINPDPRTGMFPESPSTGGGPVTSESLRDHHDCWCRQSYRVRTATCTGASTGDRFIIQRFRCPSSFTANTIQSTRWQNIGSWFGQDCECVEGPAADMTRACHTHYGVGTGQLTGQARHARYITCPDGSSGAPNTCLWDGSSCITDSSLEMWDTSDCRCPPNAPQYSADSCSGARINSFVYGGTTYNNVAELFEETWHCPPPSGPNSYGVAYGTPPATASQAGGWAPPELVHAEACICPDPKNELVDCPPNLTGSGNMYEVPYDCDADVWTPPGTNYENWTLIPAMSDCNTCSYTQPMGEGELRDPNEYAALGVELGTGQAICDCTTGTAKDCWRPTAGGGGSFEQWYSCPCQ